MTPQINIRMSQIRWKRWPRNVVVSSTTSSYPTVSQVLIELVTHTLGPMRWDPILHEVEFWHTRVDRESCAKLLSQQTVVRFTPDVFFAKKGRIMPGTPTAAQTMTLGDFSYFSIVLRQFVPLQQLQLWVLISPPRWNTTSSETMILSRKFGDRETQSKISCAKDARILLARFNACTIWGLSFLKPSFIRPFFTVSLLMLTWFPILLRDCWYSCSTSLENELWINF